ncbi:leucyl/phenylalanyl-tRNA--protein transferase [Thioalkalivibrio sp. ALgr1]|uniref:leucyl/phenylalanyl-tRNA--protein transferase n=1 Tax=Thioalkalivibrio sp. ALgr1 TaxID=748655 RepID=UPI00036CD933|nr:leucyl/phenylalanyl-tRNA--protein transferase [Thioalkalivibrio sp. ALgr1]
MTGGPQITLPWLDPEHPEAPFPDPGHALRDPNGLLAAGGDLSVPRLLNAYRSGVFPWFEAGQPILWWSPDPRAVLEPAHFRLHRSLKKAIRNRGYTVSFDRAFEAVIEACAGPREYAAGTWITGSMQQAYIAMHRTGHAHSVEVWDGPRLIGGLYGVAVGRLFCGESMFSRERDASKIALAWLCRHLVAWGWPLVDVQMETEHLRHLGAITLPRREFIARIREIAHAPEAPGPWRVDPALSPLDPDWNTAP